MSNVVRSAMVQTRWTGDKESMIDLHEQYLREAASQGAQILSLIHISEPTRPY